MHPGSKNRPSAVEKLERNRRILGARLAGAPLAEIARREHLSERQCRNVIRDWKEEGAAGLQAEDPVEVVYDLLQRYRRIEEDLAKVAAEADNSAAQVGAYRARLEAIDRQVQLMQAAGLLPKELGQLHVSADVRSVTAQVVAVFRDHQVSDATTSAVIAALTAGSA